MGRYATNSQHLRCPKCKSARWAPSLWCDTVTKVRMFNCLRCKHHGPEHLYVEGGVVAQEKKTSA